MEEGRGVGGGGGMGLKERLVYLKKKKMSQEASAGERLKRNVRPLWPSSGRQLSRNSQGGVSTKRAEEEGGQQRRLYTPE